MLRHLKKNNLIWLQKILLAGLIFTLPSNLFKTFYLSSAYIQGLRVDYLIPKLYLSDVVLLLLLISLVTNSFHYLQQLLLKLQQQPLLLLLIILLVGLQIKSSHPTVAILAITRIVILSLTAFLVYKQQVILKSKLVTNSVKLTVVFQSILAWFQYLRQKSLIGYYLLGETNLSNYVGIAKTTILGQEKILPYGTTAHPNILGGVLVILTLVIFNLVRKNKQERKLNLVISALAITTIILTQSVSAILALITGVVTMLLRSKLKLSGIGLTMLLAQLIIVVILTLPQATQLSNPSIYRRALLNKAAIKMFQNQPLTGVGLQNFTASLEKYSHNQEVVRFVQPVHNLLLLIVSETGLVGIVTLIIILNLNFKAQQNKAKHPEFITALIPIMALDHYLLTVQSGLVLLFLSFSYAMLQDLGLESGLGKELESA